MAKKLYVVFNGKTPGIYKTWPECQEQTKGVKGAKYKSYEDHAEAIKAFDSFINQEELSVEEINNSISTDGSCLGSPGKMEYRVVKTETGETIFHSPIYELGTNNIGEFLALVEAIKYVDKNNLKDKVVFTDSVTAISWVQNKKYNTTLEQTEKTKELYDELRKATEWLKTKNIQEFKIAKWKTELFGEIKADFGRK
jgi:ribonuclease HI